MWLMARTRDDEDAFSLTHSSRELWRREKVLGIISSQWIIDEKEFRPSTHKLQYIYFPIYDNLLEERENIQNKNELMKQTAK